MSRNFLALRTGSNLMMQLCERFGGQLLYWWAIALCFGASCYFWFNFEPDLMGLWGLVASLSGLTALVWRFELRRRAEVETLSIFIFKHILLCALGFSLGIAVTALRTHMVAAPVLEAPINKAFVVGELLRTEPRSQGLRLYIKPVSISGLSRANTPELIRVTWQPDHTDEKSDSREGVDLGLDLGNRFAFVPGDQLSFSAFLIAPSGPPIPGGYDFARQAWFLSLGAVGRIRGPVMKKEEAEDIGSERKSGHKISRYITQIRAEIVSRLQAGLPAETSGVAIAVLTGHRSQLTSEVRQMIADAGLAHLLAISGLHIGLVAAIAFVGFRFLGSCSRYVSETFDLKTMAALLSLPLAVSYVLISGQAPSAVRALIMASLVMVAIACQRDPFTLRFLSIAAIVMVLLTPEIVISPGFQMSFAAVMALICLHERVRMPSPNGFFRRGLKFWLGIAFASLIATAATAPFSLFHFNQIAGYGLLSNLIGIPAFACLIMVPGLLALLVMPFGLEAGPLAVLDFGLSFFLSLAQSFADLPHAALYGLAPSGFGCAVIVLGGLLLLLLRGHLKWIGLPLMLGPLVAAQLSTLPVLIASERGIGILAADETLLTHKTSAYVRTVWSRVLGLGVSGAQKLEIGRAVSLKSGLSEQEIGKATCQRTYCVVRLQNQTILYIMRRRDSAQNTATRGVQIADCRDATFVLWASVPDQSLACAASETAQHVRLQDTGTVTLTPDGNGGAKLLTTADFRGKRLWIR